SRDRRRAGCQPQRRAAPHADRRPAQHRPPRGHGRASVAGIPVCRAAVAGLLPRADGAAGAGPQHRGGRAPCRGPGHPAPAQHDRAAAPVLAADAGDLADAVALLAAPAQAGGADAVASALPRRLRFPGAAAGRVARARRGHRVLAGCAGQSGCRHRPSSAGRGRGGRGRATQASPAPSSQPRRRMNPVVACVGLGGNVGEVAQTLAEAVRALAALPGSRLLRASRVYRTPAWGRRDQPDFLNAAATLETTLLPRQLLDALLAIEQRFGRARAARGGERWGPRTLDLDLLLYGEAIVDEPGLQVP